MNNPQPQPPRQKPARPRLSILRLIAIVFLTLIILVGIAVLIIWLVVRPRHLVYTVEDGSIHSFNIADNHLNSTFDFILRAYNPNNKVSVYYDSIEARVEYDDQTLASDAVQPFFQPHKNVTRFEVKLKSQSVALFGSMPKDLKLERSSGGVELSVQIKAKIRFKVGAWKSRHMILRVYCSPVLVHFSSSRGFERTYCDVEL
ncbi:hypothetical protein FNV43_RR05600 [Rhamnella rubrinervis]|uniref:Late embryogenesis abundant protein LEA-2 subgroup domain-containing protein n=1 Tax=Rhamnella rubrinervis TaxID=2594499 RepID=A0A8K0MQT7_9ROSA|nr:hypothetical protein FNV43_RR05600 [Rhamnella rubrinervis]